ncbi:purine-cytosine permease family protein [Jeotgalibacillus haloalkalitolerans]|uniref:Cytosine permease n=1 Tax=Jeotgalibacillus haloalkalitolerans TaxID=3104292 RepID=A0ABU5KMS9_9BACL|nr:cytosine permease [Jeotgalibacillus sp. HH7-29]MDZ5712465.1 cytosine permease [Jeotgalibacillus sp. HH7-29]
MTTAVNKKRIQIETIGLSEVPESEKKTRWFDYAFIQMAFSVNTGNVLVPALAVTAGGLSAGTAISSTLIGAVLAFILVSILSLPGARYGLPAQYVIRTMIGSKLSMYFASPVRSLTSLYWFAVQTIGGSIVVQFLLNEFAGILIPLYVLAPLFSIIMAVLALIGFEAVKKTIKWFIPLLFLSQLLMLFLIIDLIAADTSVLSRGEFSIGTCFFYGSLAFMQYVSGVSASSDITRYAKSPKEGFIGVLTGNIAGFAVVAVLGALFASALQSVNPFVSASMLTDSNAAIVLIAAGAIISMISINLSNAYTGGYSLLNALPSLGRVKSAVVFGIAATALSLFPGIVEEAETYISLLGAAIVPLSAVIIADYVMVKKMNITKDHLIRLTAGSHSANLSALFTVLLFVPVYFLIPDTLSPGLIVFTAACVFYTVLQKLVTNRSEISHN